MTRVSVRAGKAVARSLVRLGALPFVLAIAHIVVLPVTAARADVPGAMQAYFDDMNAAANVSGPSAFDGQSAGYYTMGNIWTRFPQTNTNIANLQLPSARAGCGGIDLFGGSFSFINAAEIIALLKAVANNAVGYAFQLAIDTVCPECGSVMKDFAQKVQLMNNMAINSCDVAQGLVNTVAGRSDMAERNFCEMVGTFKGIFSDAAAAKHGCGSKGERASTNDAAAGDAELADASPAVPRNYTWHVLKKSAFFSPDGVLDQELAEYVMTMVGTVIYVPPTDTTPGKYTEFADPVDPALMTAVLDGTADAPVKILKCDEPVDCLNPTYQSLDVPGSAAIRPRVDLMLQDMVTAIVDDTAITSQQRDLLQVASIPLYKMLAVEAAVSRGLTSDNRQVLAEFASLDMVFAILDRLMSEARRGMANFIGADETKLARWTAGMQSARQTLLDRQKGTQAKVSSVLLLIERTAHIESVLQSSMSPAMAASLDWSRAARTGSLN